MGDQGTSEAEKVDLGQGSHEQQQGGPEPAKDEKKKDGEDKMPPIAPRPAR